MATSHAADVEAVVVVEKRSDPSPVVARVAISRVVDVVVVAEAVVVEKRLDLSPVVVRVVTDLPVLVPMAVEDAEEIIPVPSLVPSHNRSNPQLA